MCNLLIDLGNSRLKWAVISDGITDYAEPQSYSTANLTEILLTQWSHITPARVVCCSSTNDENNAILKSFCQQQWDISPEYIQPEKSYAGVTSGYSNPEELGTDRWLALIAGYNDIGGNICIVDCGTAITIDLIKADGTHLGGLITPGLQLQLDSLTENIDRLSAVDQDSRPTTLLAQDTGNAIIGGVIYSTVAFIDRAASDLSHALDEDISYIITGGDTGKLLPLLTKQQYNSSSQWIDEPHLVLQGLSYYL